TDRRQLEHGVEGRDLQHPDIGHAQQVADGAQRRLGHPAFLLLDQPQDRDHRRLATRFRVLLDPPLSLFHRLLRKLERGRLLLGETTNAHRSTSPNTMSSEPRMADTSASMWPRFIQSIACR